MSMLYELPLIPEFCSLLTVCLIHTFWQGMIIALVVALLVRQKLTVHQRFATAFSLLVLIGVLPICNYAWLTHSRPTPVVERATERFTAEPLALFELSELKGHILPATNRRSQEDAIAFRESGRRSPNWTSRVEATSEAGQISRAEADDAAGAPLANLGWTVVGTTAITILYLAGVLAMVVRLGFGVKSHWRLTNVCKRMGFAEQVPHAVIVAAEQAASSLGRRLQTPIALFYGEGAALVVGCIRPVILINASLVSGLTPLQLEQVLAHELAHVYRFDPLTQLIQRLVESLLFFHPGVWYVSRTVSDLRELRCDELATQNYSRVDFAATLLQCAVLNRCNKAAQFTLAATGSHSSQLTSRIDALLQSKDLVEHRPSRRWMDASATRNMAFALIGVLLMLVAIRGSGKLIRSPLQVPIQQADENTTRLTPTALNLDWKWVTEELYLIKPSQFLFGGKQLSLDNTIPSDVVIQAMVDDTVCKFAQWHFGDSSSTRVAILVEMDGHEINRLFIDRNRDRIIDDSEAVTVRTKNEKTWLADLDVEVHENGSVVRVGRKIGMTPSRDRTKIRVTTIGFAEGQIEVGDKTYQARRVDKDGDGLPTGKLDQLWIDFNHDDQFDKLTERLKLDSILRINQSRFLVRSDRLGQSLALTPDDEVGFVQFHFELADKTATLETFEGSLRDESGMLVAVRIHEKPTPVPVGRYCLQDLVVQVRDKNSAVWRMTLSRGLGSQWSKINPDTIIEIKQDAVLKVPLLRDLDFSFVSEHVSDQNSLYKTELNPSIRTGNGLTVTDFTKETPNESLSLYDNSVIAKFKVRDAKGTFAEPPEQCSSSFG